MIFRTSSKIIAAVLTAALAVSPVFVMPISASDGQEVETEASSWRYQDGDIIVDEGLDAFDADTDQELLEDYNAQMGSSMSGEEAAEPAEEPAPEQITESEAATEGEAAADGYGEEIMDPVEGDAADPDGVTEDPYGVTADPLDEAAADPAEGNAEDPAAMTGPEQGQEEVPEVFEEEGGEPVVSAASATVKNKYWTWSSGKYKRGPGYLKGIDVSVWQGTINWKKVKKAGVDFAIIRCGYGPNTSSKDDSKFAANVAGCKKYGIPYGVYLYSYANSVSEAKDEANHAIRLLRANNCKLSYPIYYDLEDSQVAKASNATIVKMANEFCGRMKDNGYAAGVYANLNWWTKKLSKFNGYDKWVAQWDKKCTYTKAYSIWQCTSSAGANGISGRVDANLLMVPQADMDSYMKSVKNKYWFKTENGKQYCMDSEGNLVTNRFVKVDGYFYGIGEDGAKLKDGKYWIGYKKFILDKKGRAYIAKAKVKKKAKYYKKPGKGSKGTLKKGKKFYVLKTKGHWTKMADGYWIETKYTKKIAVYPVVKPSSNVKYKAVLKKKTVSRSGPAEKYLAKKTFGEGSEVTVIGTYEKWSKISSGVWLPSSNLKK